MYSFIVLPALALYLYLAWKAMGAAYRSTRHPVLKFAYPAVALAVLAVLPFADIIYPRWKLAQLCATEARTEVVTTTTLPAEYFGKDGRLVSRDGNPLDLDWGRLKPVLKVLGDEETVAFGGVRKLTQKVIDQRNGQLLVVQTYFLYRGGWIAFTEQGLGRGKCLPPETLEETVGRAVGRVI